MFRVFAKKIITNMFITNNNTYTFDQPLKYQNTYCIHNTVQRVSQTMCPVKSRVDASKALALYLLCYKFQIF